MAAGRTPQVSLRAVSLPEATGRCQRLSASVCHLSSVSSDSASASITALSLWLSFWLMIWDTQTAQVARCHHLPCLYSSVLIPYVKQQTQGQGVCHVSLCGFERKCAGVVSSLCWCMKAGRVTLLVCTWAHSSVCLRASVYVCVCVSTSRAVLSDSVSEVQPGGGSL